MSDVRNGDAVIEARGLRMAYGEKQVLQGVDLTLARGEVVALLGANGAGKTTTIEILEGFRAPSAGEVRVLGENPLTAGEAWRARLGVVLQSWRDHARWRVGELLDQFGRYYGPFSAPSSPRPIPTDELLALVGLSEHAGAKIMSLSGGQRRRLDVAIGIVGRPEMLFLDEPTVGFDPVARREFHELVHRLADLDGTSILLTTHDLAEAEKLADRILILAGGVIIANGSPAELARQFSTTSEVRWRERGVRHVHATADATAFVRELLGAHRSGIDELEIVRSSLEDTYLSLVRAHELTATTEEAA